MQYARVVSTVEERFPDTEEVAGSSPAPPTTNIRDAFGHPFFVLFKSVLLFYNLLDGNGGKK